MASLKPSLQRKEDIVTGVLLADFAGQHYALVPTEVLDMYRDRIDIILYEVSHMQKSFI